MTQEEVLEFLNKVMNACLVFIAFTVFIFILFSSAGYAVEKYREAKCINSACETKCKENARFIRHEGCLK